MKSRLDAVLPSVITRADLSHSDLMQGANLGSNSRPAEARALVPRGDCNRIEVHPSGDVHDEGHGDDPPVLLQSVLHDRIDRGVARLLREYYELKKIAALNAEDEEDDDRVPSEGPSDDDRMP